MCFLLLDYDAFLIQLSISVEILTIIINSNKVRNFFRSVFLSLDHFWLLNAGVENYCCARSQTHHTR
jgi:hypothetical protein